MDDSPATRLPEDSDEHPFVPPERFNIADYFLGDRIREGRGDRRALLTAEGELTYAQVEDLSTRFATLLRRAGVRPEERVLIALPDGPAYVAAIFATLRLGAVVITLNPHLRPDEIEYFFEYTRGGVLFVDTDRRPFFRAVMEGVKGKGGAGAPSHAPREMLVVDDPAFRERIEAVPPTGGTFPTHRDDAAAWIFSGGTTGRPKAAIQTHASFANSTECYAKRVIGYREDDITLAVPKLFFGYATGSNLFFPFAAGATAALFPERSTPDVVFECIERFRPTILVNVPTMINQMLAEPGGPGRDLSSLRIATSAGEALPVELHRRWDEAYGVELLDGLGTAEMWHIFLSNRPGDVHPGTLGKVVPGFDVRVRDDDGRDLPDGEMGWLWVRGDSRALGYWQDADRSRRAFRGEWYVSGDMVSRDAEGVFTYGGRGDDMLKVKGKWLAPREVENCLLEHPAVSEVAVVGVTGAGGLTESVAWVVPTGEAGGGLADELRELIASRLASYKAPRTVRFVDELPRTHLGKVDRGELRGRDEAGDAR